MSVFDHPEFDHHEAVHFFDDPGMPGLAERFAKVTAPVVAVSSLDDAWAPPISRDTFMAGYSQAPYQAIDVRPQAIGMTAIGHMGYFRPEAHLLWADMLTWFDTSAHRDVA